MNAQEIKDVVIRYFSKKGMCIHTEVGLNKWGKLRADLVALSMRGDLTVIEVKSSKRDFLTDKKMLGYLPYCHKMYLAMTEDVYEEVVERIPAEIGVFVVADRYYPSGRTRKVLKVVQKTRHKEMDAELRFNMIIRMAYKSSDYSRFPSARRSL